MAFAVAGITAVAVSTTALSATSSGRPGCDPTRAAVAFTSDGHLVANTGPVPCTVRTGFGGGESRIAVAPNGDVLETPAVADTGLLGTPLPGGSLPVAPHPDFVFTQNAGIGWTTNQGATWRLIKADGNLCPQGDNDLYIDRRTGRLFYSCIFAALPDPANQYAVPYGPRAELLTSPRTATGYNEWNSVNMEGYLSENPRFTTAPAPVGQVQPVPGEDVAYWCANLVNLPNLQQRACSRSLDGGQSWQFASLLFTNPAPQHKECGSSGESFDGGYPQGASDGSVWVMVVCGNNHFLARSRNEAKSWPLVTKPNGQPVTIPGSPTQLRVDTAGNLYTFEENGNAILLRISRDGGQTWTAALNMTAPSVRNAKPPSSGPPNPALVALGLLAGGGKTPVPSAIYQWGAAIGYQPGQVAVSYLVVRPGGGYDGYITATRQALASNPVFYATTANAPAKPIVTNPSLSDDFITLDVGPDGTPWAGFYSDCVKLKDGHYEDPSCEKNKGVRVIPFVPPVQQDTAKAMTIASLRWP
jgi:hypothetical protein